MGCIPTGNTFSAVSLIASPPGAQLNPECKHGMGQRWPVSPGVDERWAVLAGFQKAHLQGLGCREQLCKPLSLRGEEMVGKCPGQAFAGVACPFRIPGSYSWRARIESRSRSAPGMNKPLWEPIQKSLLPPKPNSCCFPGLAPHSRDQSLPDPQCP